jgi:hypothetical protein
MKITTTPEQDNDPNIGNGDAPCGSCGEVITSIPVLLDTQEPDGWGGYWYQVKPGQTCPNCGEPLKVYHVPPKESEKAE